MMVASINRMMRKGTTMGTVLKKYTMICEREEVSDIEDALRAEIELAYSAHEHAAQSARDFWHRAEAAEAELADTRQRLAAVELERDEWHEVCTRMSVTLGKTEARAETAERCLAEHICEVTRD
jgi:hypothetical protein